MIHGLVHKLLNNPEFPADIMKSQYIIHHTVTDLLRQFIGSASVNVAITPRTARTALKMQDVATMVHANCSQMVDEIAAAAGISHSTCQKILLVDLNMSRVTQQSVPHVLM
jgi:hypothetical protein